MNKKINNCFLPLNYSYSEIKKIKKNIIIKNKTNISFYNKSNLSIDFYGSYIFFRTSNINSDISIL